MYFAAVLGRLLGHTGGTAVAFAYMASHILAAMSGLETAYLAASMRPDWVLSVSSNSASLLGTVVVAVIVDLVACFEKAC